MEKEIMELKVDDHVYDGIPFLLDLGVDFCSKMMDGSCLHLSPFLSAFSPPPHTQVLRLEQGRDPHDRRQD